MSTVIISFINTINMKKLALYYLLFLSVNAFCQEGAYKMDVPAIALGEKQNYQVLSFEALANDKYAILYMQELPASIVGDKEFRNEKYDGAYEEKDGKRLVSNSNRVIFLVRQTLSKTAAPTTDFWVVAVRELQSDMKYTMYYPPSFVHPIIKDGIEVNYSLKNLDLIKGLSPREFDALVLLGKRTYGFYTYPALRSTSKTADLVDNIKLLKSDIKQLKAALGKGDIPKEEKQLFKREVLDKARLVATRLDKKDSVQIKLYMSTNDDSHYELLKSQTYFGSVMPGFATTLVYDPTLKVSAAFGYVQLKYKDASGAKAIFLALGIDNNGDPQFWSVDAGKNTLNSFLPWLAFSNENGIYVVSRNQEKMFKPIYQYHLLKRDGSVTTLCPTSDADLGLQKSEYMYADPEKKAAQSTTGNYSPTDKVDFPVGIFDWNKSKLLFTGAKISTNNTNSVVTSYGDISVMRIDADNKIKQTYEVQQNQSSEPVYPSLLGSYKDNAYFLVNYHDKFMLKVAADKMEAEPLENSVSRLVYIGNNDCIATNQFGNMFLTKTIVGNKYTLQFFPGN